MQEDEGIGQLLLDSLPSSKAIQPTQHPLSVEPTEQAESVQVQTFLDQPDNQEFDSATSLQQDQPRVRPPC